MKTTHSRLHNPKPGFQIYLRHLLLSSTPSSCLLCTSSSPETVYFSPPQRKEVIFDKSSLRIYEIILPEPPKTYTQKLRIFQGRISKAGFWRTAWKPVPLITFPIVTYAAFT
jgi:hypothetical protein